VADEKTLQLHHTLIPPGSTTTVKIPVGRIPSGNAIDIRAHVVRAQEDGPTVLILGGVHGDEVNGIEIVRRSIEEGLYQQLLRGTVIAIPLVNIYGFINFSREVPDGKDINRSFPGNHQGSLAARVAFHVSRKILPLADIAIDYHTGGGGNYNYPQIRYTPEHPESLELAQIFAAPYLLAKKAIRSSLRRHAIDLDIPLLVYEGGENLRMDPFTTSQGLEGLRRVLIAKGMLSGKNRKKNSLQFEKTTWIRSPRAGIFQYRKTAGQIVHKGEVLGYINDAYGTEKKAIIARRAGHIIGHNNIPVVSQGDALFHLAYN